MFQEEEEKKKRKNQPVLVPGLILAPGRVMDITVLSDRVHHSWNEVKSKEVGDPFTYNDAPHELCGVTEEECERFGYWCHKNIQNIQITSAGSILLLGRMRIKFEWCCPFWRVDMQPKLEPERLWLAMTDGRCFIGRDFWLRENFREVSGASFPETTAEEGEDEVEDEEQHEGVTL